MRNIFATLFEIAFIQFLVFLVAWIIRWLWMRCRCLVGYQHTIADVLCGARRRCALVQINYANTQRWNNKLSDVYIYIYLLCRFSIRKLNARLESFVDAFHIHKLSFVSLIVFILHRTIFVQALNWWKLKARWGKKGVVWTSTNEIKLAHWEDSVLAIFIFHSLIFIPFIVSLVHACTAHTLRLIWYYVVSRGEE